MRRHKVEQHDRREGDLATKATERFVLGIAEESGRSTVRIVVIIVIAAVVLLVGYFLIGFFWSEITSPIHDAWEWTKNAPGEVWEWATDWLPDKQEQPETEPAPVPAPTEVPEEAPEKEPGFWCKGMLEWNPLCK